MSRSDLRKERVGASRSLVATIFGDYLFAHLGYFAVLPILSVLLTERDYPPLAVGASLFALSFATKGATLFLAKVLHPLQVRTAAVAGLVASAAGFLGTGLTATPIAAVVCLTVAGAGISVNALAIRGLVAVSTGDAATRNRLYGLIQVVINVAAAVGPILGNVVYGAASQRTVFYGIALCYLTAAAAVIVLCPRGALSDGAVRPPLGIRLVGEVLRPGPVRRLAWITVVGSLGYAQFFSAFALSVAEYGGSSLFKAGVFTANAVVVVAAQGPATMLVNRFLSRGLTYNQILGIGALLFAVSFVPVAFAARGIAWLIGGAVLIAAAETIFTPTVATAFIEQLPGIPTVEVLNYRQLASSVGESIGTFIGGATFILFLEAGAGPAYWGLVALIIGALSLPYLVRK